jgi:2-C-methyl-D-erythritol 4-phosphate cytidylyltransferase/2-C-methyl-D-erythritol 2,4-cyclodiphosphate synthase
MKVVAVILAAGSGSRFGKDKTLIDLGGKPLWRWSYDAFAQHPQVASVGIVCSADNYSAIRAESDGAEFVVVGGAVRQDSSRAAVQNVPADADIVLIHDAARPLISQKLISDVIDGVLKAGAAAPGLPVTDTVKEVLPDRVRTLDRSKLFTVQTPQGANLDLLTNAHRDAKEIYTDEMGLVEAYGVRPEIVPGDPGNVKVTTPEDFERIRSKPAALAVRSGIGYDVHRFSDDPTRPLMLGGVRFEGPGLAGHSDADVLIHAVVDALLGAAGLGDIGRHFPDTEARWKDQPSTAFLEFAADKLAAAGWSIGNVDVTLIAELPKITPHSEAVRANLAEAMGVDPARVNIKATTNETMGAIGRREGIAAFAVATIAECIGGERDNGCAS